MSKKNIQIIVVVVAFLASGLIIYNGMFKKTSSPPVSVSQTPGQETAMPVVTPGGSGVQPAPGEVTSNQAKGFANFGYSNNSQQSEGYKSIRQDMVLPYGNDYDPGKILEEQELQFGVVVYPKLDPVRDLGVAETDLIKPQPVETKISK